MANKDEYVITRLLCVWELRMHTKFCIEVPSFFHLSMLVSVTVTKIIWVQANEYHDTVG